MIGNELAGLLLRVVQIAEDGLRIRSKGEGEFLKPLYDRAERIMSPARQIREGIKAGKSMKDFVYEFGGYL